MRFKAAIDLVAASYIKKQKLKLNLIKKVLFIKIT